MKLWINYNLIWPSKSDIPYRLVVDWIVVVKKYEKKKKINCSWPQLKAKLNVLIAFVEIFFPFYFKFKSTYIFKNHLIMHSL